MTPPRQRLPNRRRCETTEIDMVRHAAFDGDRRLCA